MFGNERRKKELELKARASGISKVMDEHYESNDKHCKTELKTGREIVFECTNSSCVIALTGKEYFSQGEEWSEDALEAIKEEMESVSSMWLKDPQSFKPKKVTSSEVMEKTLNKLGNSGLLKIALATSINEEEYQKKVSFIYKKKHQKSEDEAFFVKNERYKVLQKYGEVYFTKILPQIRDILQE